MKNKKGFAISSLIYSILILFIILIFGVLTILGTRKVVLDKMKNDVMDKLNGDAVDSENNDYKDSSGASKPELDNGLIPVVYDGTNWKVADKTARWYDYNSKEWANAIIVKTGVKANYVKDKVIVEDDVLGYFVWIPRYEYTVNAREQAITINFVSKVSAKNDKTHPAFTFGTTELNGLWVAKFEATGDATTPTVKPNITSLRNQNISTQFTTAQKYTTYGLTNSDSHMMKNSEWGSIAYLTQSIYGRCESATVCSEVSINNSSSFITGSSAGKPGDSTTGTSTVYAYNTPQGLLASTTGNIYGIYDMSGGSWEYVMGNYNNTISSSGFSTMPAAKYFNNYPNPPFDGNDSTNTSKCTAEYCNGSALNETQGWYSDDVYFVSFMDPWFIRGGEYSFGTSAGAFSFHSSLGSVNSNYSFRPVITKP